MDRTRNIVLNMLIDTLEKGIFRQTVISQAFEAEHLSGADKAFVNRLYAGTLEKIVYLDYILGRYSSVPVKKMKPVIRNILRMSLYQMRFMDSVPVHACLHEAVALTRKRGFSNLTGFVNGILRAISRETDTEESLPAYVRACVPEWIYQFVTSQYGSRAESFFQAVQEKNPDTSVWFNLQKEDRDVILKSLEQDGCNVKKLPCPDTAYGISGFSDLTSLRAFQNGWIMIQDVSSMLAAETVIRHTSSPEQIVDVCAAPGGKSMYLAHAFPRARILARDLSAQKTARIEENAARLGFRNIETQVFDACVPDPALKEQMDVVVADLPCSGLGVIRHKPDILYRLRKEDLLSLQKLQRDILKTVHSYVKPGGILLYSTCTINRDENEENTRWLLEHANYRLLEERLFFPGQDPGDGFYAACLQKLPLPGQE